MREVFSSKTIRLYHGNALTILPVLPTASVDAVVTDPPYSSGGVSLSAKQSDPAQKYQTSGTIRTYPPMLGDGKDQRAFTAWAMLWLSECWRVAKDGAPLLIFTDWRQLPSMTDAIQAAGWFWLGIVPWNKRGARPQLGKFRQQCEYVLFGSKGRFQPANGCPRKKVCTRLTKQNAASLCQNQHKGKLGKLRAFPLQNTGKTG
jgi:site-specific DNA-methyltransferase (adenine-specific)